MKRALIVALLVAGVVTVAAARVQTDGNRLFGQTLQEFAMRRTAVRKAADGGIVLLFGIGDNEDVGRTRFRTDDDMMYLTGVEAPETCLALLPNGDPSGKTEILFLPYQNPRNLVWSDPVPGPGPETQKATGIQSIQDLRDIWTALNPSIQKARTVYLMGPVASQSRVSQGGDGVSLAGQYFPNGAAELKIKSINPNAEIRGTAGALIESQRRLKSAGEVANLRAAIAATGNAELAAGKTIKEGTTELEIEGHILSQFRKGGGVREGFPTIVGSGINSTILHHFSSMRIMRNGEMVVCDIGAEFNYYSADITRTFPVSGHFTPRQRAIYQLVLDTQTAARNMVVVGKTTLFEQHMFAANYLRNSPLRAKGSDGKEYTMNHFFPHGLGHPLGLDVHDVSAGNTRLDPGFVFTIEPGIYIPSEGFGVRIEDDYLATPSGIVKLSEAIPSKPDEIEALMAAGAASRGGAGRVRSAHSTQPRNPPG